MSQIAPLHHGLILSVSVQNNDVAELILVQPFLLLCCCSKTGAGILAAVTSQGNYPYME